MDLYQMKKNMETNEKRIRLKVNKNNQITITKVKDSWSREEVIELLLSLNKDKPGNFDCSAWISENL